jgi:D-alanine transaminase
MPELASVDGVVTPLAEAVVSITDRGFLFGDAAYEVVRVYGGVPFRLEAHVARLLHSCRGLRFAAVPDAATLARTCRDLIARSGLAEAALGVQVTRGLNGPTGVLSAYRTPSVVVRVERPPAWPAVWYEEGTALVTVPEQRWAHNELKTVNLLPRILAWDDAHAAGAAEALWTSPDGAVLEGLSSNLFAVFGAVLWTPPVGAHVLAGVTRGAVLELAPAAGLTVREERLPYEALRAADEVFTASSTRELVPVVRLDGAGIGAGRPGPRTLDLLARYRALVRSVSGAGSGAG